MGFLSILLQIFVRATLLGVVLMGAWDYGLTKFFTQAPQVGLLESFYVLFTFQALSTFLVRPINQQFVPIYIPLKSEHFPKDE